jgi:outer membrane protein assembly factor BamB
MPDIHDALNRYLDDLAEARSPDLHSVEPGTRETIHRLSQLGAVLSANALFVDRLEERLLRTAAHASGGDLPLPSGSLDHGFDGRVRSVRLDRRGKGLSLLIAAALLLFVIGVGYRTLERVRDEDRAVIPAPTSIAPEPDSKTTFRGDASRTGTMLGPAVTGVPAIIWDSPTWGEATGATSAVGDGLVIVTDAGTLLALDQATGDEVWRTPIRATSSSPLIHSGMVILGTLGNGLQAFDLSTGAGLWTFRAGAVATNPDEPADHFPSSPAIVDDTVFIGGGFYGGLFAVDPETGAEKWRFDSHGEVWSSPAVADGVVYITTQGLRDAYPDDPTPSALYAIDVKTGEQLWWFPLGPMDTSHSTPMVSAGMVVFGATHEDSETGTWFALDAATGTELWRLETEHPIWGRSPGSNGNLIFLTEETDAVGNLIRAVEPATGTTVWTFEVQDERINGVVNTGDVLYIKDNAADLIALDAATGTELWRMAFPRGGTPVVMDGRIYLVAGAYAYAIGPASALPGTPRASPVATPG